MKQSYYIFSLLFFLFANTIFSQKSFYYYDGDKIPLNRIDNLISIRSNSPVEISEYAKINSHSVSKEGQHQTIIEIRNKDVTEFVSNLRKNKNINFIFPVYENIHGEKLAVSNTLYFKLKTEIDRHTLKKIANNYGLKSIKQNQFMPLWFSCEIKNRNNINPLNLANKLYETGKFLAVEADLYSIDSSTRCTDDADFDLLWGLQNSAGPDINACDAWNITDGTGATVAVLDVGIDLDHMDLSTNIINSFDTETNTSPSQIYDNNSSHGTLAAGIIGAVSNTDQVVGVAHGASLLSISNKMEGSSNSREERANGILWAVNNGADVISNSWSSAEQSLMIEDAIDIALTQGRGNRGCVIVHPTGNKGLNYIEYPASLYEVLAVGSINQSGTKASHSNYDIFMDVVAPGKDIWSTSVNDNIAKESGTSMAVPYVSGVAALTISANPFLTSSNVRDIIKSTAQKVGGYDYDSSSFDGRNEYVGYGLVDAKAAVESAIEIDAPDVICLGESVDFSIKGDYFSTASITWEYPNNKMYIVNGSNSPTCTFSSFTSGDNQVVKANVSYEGENYVFTKIIDIKSSSQPTAPTIAVANDNPQNLYCCGTSYLIDHAQCTTGCSDLEWQETIYSQGSTDNYSFVSNDKLFRIHVNKNTYSPLVIGVKARKYASYCNTNPSEWSSEVSRYYGTESVNSFSTKWAMFNSIESINQEMPIQEYYLNNDKSLYVNFIDIYEWLDLKYSNKNLNQDEISTISHFLKRQYEKPSLNIKLYNTQGFKIENYHLTENKVIDFSHLKPGVYILKYSYFGRKFNRKILVEI